MWSYYCENNHSFGCINGLIFTIDSLITSSCCYCRGRSNYASFNLGMIVSTTHPTTPTIINIQESLESFLLETAQALLVSVPTNAQAHSTIQRKSGEKAEPGLGYNKFASLNSLGEEDSPDSNKESDLMDLMIFSDKKILRERPVKQSAKAKKMYRQPTNYGCGNRGCEN